MLTTVCLNPCIDRTLTLGTFHCGETNRVLDARNDAGGKGINVAAAAAQLLEDVSCISFLHENGGSMITDKLHAFGVQSAGVHISGSLRTNLKIFDRSSSTITEINESGAPVSKEDLQKMTSLILSRARRSEILVVSGSVPPGCPADYYRGIIEQANALGCRCILDADGEKLKEGLKARPYLVKPNLSELENLLGHTLSSLSEVRNAALSLICSGISIVAVSLGAEGAFITDGTQSMFAPRMDVEVKSTVSAGDSMVAAFAAGCSKGLPLEEIFRMGVACASAAVMTCGTQPPDNAVYASLVKKVCVQRL